MTDLRAKFDATVDQVKNGTAKKKPSQEVKLEFYSLFNGM